MLMAVGLSAPSLAESDAGWLDVEQGRTLQKNLSETLHSHFDLLKDESEATYFLSYALTHSAGLRITAVEGQHFQTRPWVSRLLDVDLRVGDMSLDNTHRQRGSWGRREHFSTPLPLDLDWFSTERAIWRITDDAYRQASDQIAKIRANQSVQVEEEDPSPDFSALESQQSWQDPIGLDLDERILRERLVAASAVFKEYPTILGSNVELVAQSNWVVFVSSEGTSLAYSNPSFRIQMQAWMRSSDGTRVALFDAIDALSWSEIPSQEELETRAEQLAQRVLAIDAAPDLDPFTGPVILGGRAAGVFFHEVLGHRIEGHRQKDDQEGQTFTDKVGERILPDFLSVKDDPTLARLGDVDLVGHYAFDDEGAPAQAVSLVENGVLQGFLLSRSPIAGFPHSNGHGRREPGKAVVARQGNLIVEASKRLSKADLREALVREARRQGRDFGLFVDSIQGGFTLTGRDAPNSFQVTPDYAWKIYVDGRPDELVRGVDLIGTPLVTFGRILAAGGEVEVFNGRCGAESGWVPVSASSPSLLLSEIEVQKKEKGSWRPPILPAPGQESLP